MPSFFVYGTLTDRVQVDRLLDEWSFGPDARVDGLHRAEGRYPTLAPGGSVSGRLLETDDAATLDAYEGVDSGLYVRVELPRTDGEHAFAYVGDAARLNADAEWPGDGDLRTRVEQYLSENRVVVETGESG
ncbi:gamma-glutamylcyclotransferase family protein [Halogeometricum luteum]|uniref:Gamma-glutamylcyclotransferase n=1 Tax=Halogeometricum luteum TaxID=2950537 RepID=A0ABU2G7Y6_9EURY|nr:gamma-glutamylcyclotransferase family protein [Halogeometricum sp. S3BR5-2]MDS0296334.1 gamma-glutamylcyclotransferase [Halogeometricum sp. S3BR5-2]